MSTNENLIQPKKLTYWGQWTIATLKGFLYGTILSNLLIMIIPFESIAAIPLGLSIGYHQWKVIRSYYQDSKIWILYSSVGLITGLTIFNFIQFLTVGAFAFIPITVMSYMMLGLIIGFYQRLVLRQYLNDTKGWLMANTVGWSLGGFLVLRLDIQMFEFIKMTLDYLIISVILGGRTGLTLLAFNKRRTTTSINRAISRSECRLTVFISIGLIIVLNLFMMGPFKKNHIVHIPQEKCHDLPPMECFGEGNYCQGIVPIQPQITPHYIDYPHVDESWDNQYRSFLSRDLMMLIKYATERVACETADVASSPSMPLMLMDMSEQNGAIPGTSHGQPAHPGGSHRNGADIDVAYYQMTEPSLWLRFEKQFDDRQGHIARPVCQHTRFGLEVYRCTEYPRNLDVSRTALFVIYLSEHPNLRVIGVDGKIGRELDNVFDHMVKSGQMYKEKRKKIPLAYEAFETGRSWYRHHHNHVHISMNSYTSN